MKGDVYPKLPDGTEFFEVRNSATEKKFAYIWAYVSSNATFYRWLIESGLWEEVGGLEAKDKNGKPHGLSDSLKRHAAKHYDWQPLSRVVVSRFDPDAKPKEPQPKPRLQGEQSLFGGESG